MSFSRTVHVIDDDASVLNSTSAFLRAHAFDVKAYNSAHEFLEVVGLHTTGCVVTDVRMNGMSGLELAEELRVRQIGLPVIIITAHADISLVIEAMRCGAADLLEKPFSNRALVNSIHDAITYRNTPHSRINLDAIRERIGALTGRERDVLSRLLQGSPNKVIARELGISTRTVESHRATIMSKMNASSLAELVRMSMTAA